MDSKVFFRNLANKKVLKLGFCDSGIGGLIFALDFLGTFISHYYNLTDKDCPLLEIYHLDDRKNFPYGTKTPVEISDFGNILIKHLFNDYECDIVFVACNTLSANLNTDAKNNHLEVYYKQNRIISLIQESSIEIYNQSVQSYNLLNRHDNLNIAILGTKATINSGKYQAEINKLHVSQTPDHSYHLNLYADTPLNWEIMAESIIHPATIEQVIYPYLDELFTKNSPQSLLAIGLFCTHYPCFIEYIEHYIKSRLPNSHIKIISQGQVFAKYLANLMNIKANDTDPACDNSKLILNEKIKIYSYSNLLDQTTPREIISRLYGEEISNKIIYQFYA